MLIFLLIFLFCLCACHTDDTGVPSDESTISSETDAETEEWLDETVLTGYYTIKRIAAGTARWVPDVPYYGFGMLRYEDYLNSDEGNGYWAYLYYDLRGNLISSESISDITDKIAEKNAFPEKTNVSYRSFSDGTRVVLAQNRESGTVQLHTVDTEELITSSSAELSFLSPQWRFADTDHIIVYDNENMTMFYIFDRTLTQHGPFTTASAVNSCLAKEDGTVILCCDDFSTLYYDPVSDTVTPVTLYTETETSRHATRILYGEGVTYFVNENGMTEQRDGVETPLFDWETSELNGTRITVTEVLSDRRFLAWRQRGFDGEYEPVILHMAEKPNHEGKTVLKVASIRCGWTNVAPMIEDMVETFNRENDTYYIEYTDYENMNIVDRQSTSSWAQMKANERQLIESLQNGEKFDVILLGSENDRSSILNVLKDKDYMCDLSSFAEDVGIADSFRRAVSNNKNGEITFLPVTGEVSVLVTKEETLPQGEAFTLDKLQSIVDGLSDGQTLFGLDVSTQILAMIQGDMVDTDLGVCYFDDPKFLDAMGMLGNLKVDFQVKSTKYYDLLCGGLKSNSSMAAFYIDTGEYYISDFDIKDDPIESFRNGTLQFLSCGLVTKDSVAGLFYIMDALDGNARLCGYPTLYADETNPDGYGYFTGSLIAGMMSGTDETEAGAKAFLKMLYTKDIQSDSALSAYGLPVTEEALQTLVKEGYYYFQYGGEGAETISYVGEDRDNAVHKPRLLLNGYQKEQYDQFINATEVYITQTQCDEVLDFLCGTSVCGAPDTVIESIIDEELSAVDAGIRTREEAVKMIQSRVSIYLSE